MYDNLEFPTTSKYLQGLGSKVLATLGVLMQRIDVGDLWDFCHHILSACDDGLIKSTDFYLNALAFINGQSRDFERSDLSILCVIF